MRNRNWFFLFLCIFSLCYTACNSTHSQINKSTILPVTATTPVFPVQTSTPHQLISPSVTNEQTYSIDTSTTIAPTISSTKDLNNSISAYFEPEELYCKQDGCIYSVFQPFLRPLPADYEPVVEKTYRYGSTQNGTRESHSGVEFEAKYGTPVISVADGSVIYAGDDMDVMFGPYKDFYGNLVILEHDWEGCPQPVYTIYAHLSEILVNQGDVIKTGQTIGKIGDTGSAIGPHLHFEVRVGGTSKDNTVNPEIWLKPAYAENEGTEERSGTLIVRFIPGNKPLFSAPVLIENFTNTELTKKPYIDAESYAYDVPTDEYWNENLVVGDLSPGTYRISVTKNNRSYKKFIEIESERITLVEFDFVD